jgi:hypothetical protein
MGTSTPQRGLSLADMYFYTELRSSLGHMVAEHWLSEKSASCAGFNLPTAGLPTERRENDQLRKSSSNQGSWSQTQVSKMYFYTELRSSLGHMAAEHWLSEASASCDCSRQVSSFANTPTAELPTKRPSSIHDFRRQSQASSLISAADTAHSLSSSFSSQGLASDIERLSSGALHKCQMLKSRIMSLSFLVRKHGEKAGLLFTDAAHELLDDSSPIISRCCSVVSRCCSSALADPKVSAGADIRSSRRRSSSSHCSHSSKNESDPSPCHVASWCWSTRHSSVSNDDCFVGLIVLILAFLLLIISLRV